MTLRTAKRKLKLARSEARIIKKEIDELRQFIINAGENPDRDEKVIIARNKSIYRRWKEGATFYQIAKEFQRSPSRISDICKRIDTILEKRRPQFEYYKELQKFK